jgi:hypothetical protein
MSTTALTGRMDKYYRSRNDCKDVLEISRISTRKQKRLYTGRTTSCFFQRTTDGGTVPLVRRGNDVDDIEVSPEEPVGLEIDGQPRRRSRAWKEKAGDDEC